MNIISIFRLSGFMKQNKAWSSHILRVNRFFKDKAGAGVGFIFVIIITYVIVTLFTIYSLLVSL